MDAPETALDSIDRFIAVATEIAGLPLSGRPEFRAAAGDLYEIAHALLIANENMARWLNRFLYFRFQPTDAADRFAELAAEYRTKRAGGEFHDMKFRCGDIYLVYERNLEAAMPNVFPDDELARESARRTFVDLGSADASMVEFIYETVIGGIDSFVKDAVQCIDKSDKNGAETHRLEFKVASSALVERLERFGTQLADLVLTFARLAGRPVTLAEPTNRPGA